MIKLEKSSVKQIISNEAKKYVDSQKLHDFCEGLFFLYSERGYVNSEYDVKDMIRSQFSLACKTLGLCLK